MFGRPTYSSRICRQVTKIYQAVYEVVKLMCYWKKGKNTVCKSREKTGNIDKDLCNATHTWFKVIYKFRSKRENAVLQEQAFGWILVKSFHGAEHKSSFSKTQLKFQRRRAQEKLKKLITTRNSYLTWTIKRFSSLQPFINLPNLPNIACHVDRSMMIFAWSQWLICENYWLY